MLNITNLHASVADKPILKGLTLSLGAGEIHAIMGPNGAGKSTLSYVLGGRPGYEVTEGSVTFQPRHPGEGRGLNASDSPDRAARMGPGLRRDDDGVGENEEPIFLARSHKATKKTISLEGPVG